tara:strand:- start:1554 stop:1832 length:279 start_codon:yes stop_codon:yes gene_type:complete
MNYEELYTMTPSAFWNKVDGFYVHYENLERKEWIRTRWQTCLLMNVHLPKGKQISLQKLVKFDWEKTSESNIKSLEDTLLEYEKSKKRKNSK